MYSLLFYALSFYSKVYRELRKREIYRMADQIVEGKRRKLLADKNDKNNEAEKGKEQSQNSVTSCQKELGNTPVSQRMTQLFYALSKQNVMKNYKARAYQGPILQKMFTP